MYLCCWILPSNDGSPGRKRGRNKQFSSITVSTIYNIKSVKCHPRKLISVDIVLFFKFAVRQVLLFIRPSFPWQKITTIQSFRYFFLIIFTYLQHGAPYVIARSFICQCDVYRVHYVRREIICLLVSITTVKIS